jgi:hypothetical protein
VLVMRYTSRVEERRAKLAPEDRKVTAFSFAFSQPFNTVLIMLFVGSWTIAVGIGDKLLAIQQVRGKKYRNRGFFPVFSPRKN